MPAPTALPKTDLKCRLRIPTPALVISLIALFVALGGTSYAAMSLSPNSVGTVQLKKSAVTAPKIKDKAVTAAKIDTTGLNVPHAAHAANATNLGGHPASFFTTGTLPSGESESGEWLVAGDQSESVFAGEAVTFPRPLAVPPVADFVGTSTDRHCPGVGSAEAGYLCIYAAFSYKLPVGVVDHEGVNGTDTYGFLLAGAHVPLMASGWGSWTVTAS